MSRQVYYRRQKSTERRRDTAMQVIALVQEVRRDQPRLGTRKLYYLLESEMGKLHIGRDKLFAILKANHMLITPKRQYHVTTNSYHRFKKHKNLIENMVPSRPEQLWVADITYLGNQNHPLYLALVTDAYSKRIMGYDVSDSLATAGSIRALKMAIRQRKYPHQSVIHHSDRGFQYCSDTYQKVLKAAGINCSMTESYDPYANAVAERVNGILKQEYRLTEYGLDVGLMRQLVRERVDTYNQRRPHLSCEMLTPNQMHKQDQVRIKTYRNQNRSGRTATPV